MRQNTLKSLQLLSLEMLNSGLILPYCFESSNPAQRIIAKRWTLHSAEYYFVVYRACLARLKTDFLPVMTIMERCCGPKILCDVSPDNNRQASSETEIQGQYKIATCFNHFFI